MTWLVDPEDGRLELEPLIRIEDWFDANGNVLLDVLPDEWKTIESYQRDPEWQACEWSICRDDRWYWLTTYVWTLDVRDPKQPVKRFPADPYLFDLTKLHEARILDPEKERPNLLAEKTRAARFSLWMAAMSGHGVMFRDHYSAGILSHLFRRVDDGGKRSTPNSVIGKWRFMYGCLPSWQQAEAPLEFPLGTVRNKATGGTIIAEVANEGAGRGPQFDEVYIDEAGYVPSLTMLVAGFKSSCPSGITAGGTPNGEGTGFHLACVDAREGTSDFTLREIDWWDIPDRRACRNCGSDERRQPTRGHCPTCGSEQEAEAGGCAACGSTEALVGEDLSGVVHRQDDCHLEDGLHWDDIHDRMSSPWFREMEKALSPDMVRQELERSHSRARPGRIWSDFSREEHVSERWDFLAEGVDHVVHWDFGIDDQTSIGWGWRAGEQLAVYDDYEASQEYPPHYCNYIAWLRGEFHEWTLNGQLIAWERTIGAPRAAAIGRCWLPKRDQAIFTEAWGEPGRWRGVPLVHVGDPSGVRRESSPGSWFLNLAKGAEWVVSGERRRVGQVHMLPAPTTLVVGFTNDGKAITKFIHVDEGIQAVAHQLARKRLGLHPRAKNTIQALLNYHLHINRQGGVVSGKGPVHDQWSHSADRLRYFVIYTVGAVGVPMAAAR